MEESLNWWYEYHKEDYQAVKDRLSLCRNVMLRGNKDSAVDMLEKSTVFAVLSIQTEQSRHERAFTAFYAGDRSLEYACGETVYGNQKAEWLYESLAFFDYEKAVETLRSEGHFAALDYIVEHFKGLSWVKAAFALAMVGIWELACPDSRTKTVLGIDRRIRTKGQYIDALEQIEDSLDVDEPLFIKQWALYDYKEQEHARHMPLYHEILPNL